MCPGNLPKQHFGTPSTLSFLLILPLHIGSYKHFAIPETLPFLPSSAPRARRSFLAPRFALAHPEHDAHNEEGRISEQGGAVGDGMETPTQSPIQYLGGRLSGTPGARATLLSAFGGYALTAHMQLTHTPLNALSGVQGAPLGAPGRTGRILARTGAPLGAPRCALGAPRCGLGAL